MFPGPDVLIASGGLSTGVARRSGGQEPGSAGPTYPLIHRLNSFMIQASKDSLGLGRGFDPLIVEFLASI